MIPIGEQKEIAAAIFRLAVDDKVDKRKLTNAQVVAEVNRYRIQHALKTGSRR
jgi:hypothetical protein